MPEKKTSSRRILGDVPQVGFFPDVMNRGGKPWPEDIIFPSCMRAVMEYLGHPEYDYVHFMGVTGAGFFLNWEEGWHGDNTAIYYMVPFDEHMKLFAYTFDSTGYAMDFSALKGQDVITAQQAKRKIKASIDNGLPILCHGVVGPPETNIIAGYDDDVDVLMGWSFFQPLQYQTSKDEEANAADGFEPNGMFRKHGWENHVYDLFEFGSRSEPTDPAIVRYRSLQWAIKVTHTAQTWGGRHNGLTAFDAWADHLLLDDQITPDKTIPHDSTDCPFDVHDNAVGNLAETRYYVSEYLRRMAEHEPKMRANLLKAAGCYAAEHDLMWDVWACVGGNGRSPEHARRFAEPDTRRKIIELIHKAKKQEQTAISHIEKALDKVPSRSEE